MIYNCNLLCACVRYRGAAPIYHTLLNDEQRTGVTIITLDEKHFDAGAVLLQRSVAIDANERFGALARRLATLGAEATLEVLSDFPTRLASAMPQLGTVTLAPRIVRAQAQVIWRSSSVATLWAQWRALGDSFGIHTHWHGRRLKLVDVVAPAVVQQRLGATLATLSANIAPGSFFYERYSQLLLCRAADGWLGVATVHFDSRVPIPARQFAAGFKLGSGRKNIHLFEENETTKLS